MPELIIDKTDLIKSMKFAESQLLDADKVLRQAAFDTVALISERVQREGKNSAGEKMKTSSKPAFGAYSYEYGKYNRQNKKGFQVNIMDMTYSGDMLGDFIAVPSGKTEYHVGFRGEDTAQIAEWNEERVGKIFDMSQDEEDFILSEIDKNINAIIEQSFK